MQQIGTINKQLKGTNKMNSNLRKSKKRLSVKQLEKLVKKQKKKIDLIAGYIYTCDKNNTELFEMLADGFQELVQSIDKLRGTK